MSAEDEPVILECDAPFSRSVLWRMQRSFYAQRGLRAWTEDMIPQYITNNPFIAEIYAQVVFSFLRDCSTPVRKAATRLHILELGAGPGKFSYLFLRRLTALMRAESIPLESLRYCMTDSAASLPESWHANRYLAEFAESGILRFEQFEVGEAVHAGIAPDSACPLVVIANYVFDSLPQDAFMIEQGALLESMVTTKTAGGQPDKLSDLQLSWKNVPFPQNRYPDASWNHILEQYRSRLPGATVLFPYGTLTVLEQLSKYSDGRMLVLAADKGHTHEDNLMLVQGPPVMEMHASGQCFSQMVNFDAIGKYFENNGGIALLPEKHFASLSICGFLLERHKNEYPATQAAYRESQAAFAPDDLFALLGWLDPHLDGMSIPQILAVLRLSHWDPVALMRLFPAIARQVRGVTGARHDLRNAVMNTWQNHFPVTQAENALAFQCGVILLELRYFAEAIPMFKTSEEIFGRSAATSYNLGLCALGLERTSEALAYMVQACDLDPNFEPARASRARLEGGTD